MNKYDLITLRILTNICSEYWRYFYSVSAKGFSSLAQQIFIEFKPYRYQLYCLLADVPEDFEDYDTIKTAMEAYRGDLHRFYEDKKD